MHPAFSVIFLTTLIGAAQGLFLALYSAQVVSWMGVTSLGLLPSQLGSPTYNAGILIVLILLAGGLFASFFHLGRPERAWRSATCWRTSWLSREVIVLPAFMLAAMAYGVLNYIGVRESPEGIGNLISLDTILIVGTIGAFIALVLFVSTGMIYACVRFLQEWATPLTVINFVLLGSASGFTLACAVASFTAPQMLSYFSTGALLLIVLAFIGRSVSLVRNHRLTHKSTTQSAIGVRHVHICQMTHGAMGGSFNTREFFSGKSPAALRLVMWSFLLMVFAVPFVLVAVGSKTLSAELLIAAVGVQYLGLVLERWYFFADAQHPQNLYYQRL